ncbi:MAG TPA: hypothetical protein VHE13_10565 [Opitutus sp.]|nr:hypothetical protein [Opitutus sp.]
MSTENNPPAGKPAPAATKRTHAIQDQTVANAISEAAQIIDKALANADILALLAPRGYDATELQAGLALQAAAQAAFNARLASLGAAAEAKKARDAAWVAARAEFTDFRGTVQAKYPDAVTRKALGASGVIAGDLQKFVTSATAAYQAAQQPPHAEALAKRSFTAQRLNAAIAALQALLAADNAFKSAEGAAGADLRNRDAAVASLGAWMREFRKNAKLALKKNPAFVTTLGV